MGMKAESIYSNTPHVAVNKNDFKIIKVIGRGTFGKVLLVKKFTDEKPYAMKVLRK